MNFEEIQKALEEILSVEIVLQERQRQILDAVSSLVEFSQRTDRSFEQFINYYITNKTKSGNLEE